MKFLPRWLRLQLVKYLSFVLRIEVVRTKKVKVEIYSRLTHLKAVLNKVRES